MDLPTFSSLDSLSFLTFLCEDMRQSWKINTTDTPLLRIPSSGYFSIKNAYKPENISRGVLIHSNFCVILMKVGEAGHVQMVGSTAVLQTYQWLSPRFFHLLFPRPGLLLKMGNHIHEAHSFWQNSAYKANLKGHGHEGPCAISAPALHASTDIPCHALGWYRPLGKRGLQWALKASNFALVY